MGLAHHVIAFQKCAWPGKQWQRWNEKLIVPELCNARFLGVCGPASSGKTHECADYALTMYWAHPECTTILCSTTTREMLEMRIWGQIKKRLKEARQRLPWLPGNLVESKQMIVTEEKDDDGEGRDFRNGIKGVACKKGGTFEGLGDYIGIKNSRVILIADESQLMEAGFFDAAANLSSNPFFQLIAPGNPKDPTDPFGSVCEPKCGWDMLKQGDQCQVWDTRFRNGRCLRLVGTDSPNLDYPEGLVPFPKLITRRFIRDTADSYGKESWQYRMMVLAQFPANAADRRVITRAMCIKFGAFEEPVWADTPLVKIFCLDAAYRGVGGDRCVGGQLMFGKDRLGMNILAFVGKPLLVPIEEGKDLPKDQIARWVKKYCEEAGIEPNHFFFDGTGRSSLTSALARLWSPQVVPIEFGGPASDRPDPANPSTAKPKRCNESYGKFVTELWFSVRAVIECGQFRGITEDIVNEGQLRAWDISRNNKIDVEPKDETKKRLGRSPDLFDMLVCGVEGARRLGFQIQKIGAVLSNRKPNNILKQLQDRYRELQKSKELSHAA